MGPTAAAPPELAPAEDDFERTVSAELSASMAAHCGRLVPRLAADRAPTAPPADGVAGPPTDSAAAAADGMAAPPTDSAAAAATADAPEQQYYDDVYFDSDDDSVSGPDDAAESTDSQVHNPTAAATIDDVNKSSGYVSTGRGCWGCLVLDD